MTKFLSLLIIALCLSTFSYAQTQSGKTELGVNVGLNDATAIESGITNYNYRVGFNAGVSLDQYFSDRWSFKVKVVYDQKGWNNGYLDNGTDVYYTNYKLNYITVPLLANWHFGRTRNWYLHFGPYVAFLLSASETTGGQDLKSYFNSVDGGLDLGIGIKFPISESAKLFLEINGQGGATDMIKNNTGSSIQNSLSSFNIGINF